MNADWLTARLRTLITLAVLALLVVVAVVYGFTALTRPLPKAAVPTVCTDTPYAAGDRLRPGDVTVSVLNASDRNGLAGQTLDDLVEAGFGKGRQGNAPSGTEVSGAQIWTSEPRSPAVRMVRSWLGDDVTTTDLPSGSPGITVVVGQEFDTVADGRAGIRVRNDTVVCVPTPVDDAES